MQLSETNYFRKPRQFTCITYTHTHTHTILTQNQEISRKKTTDTYNDRHLGQPSLPFEARLQLLSLQDIAVNPKFLSSLALAERQATNICSGAMQALAGCLREELFHHPSHLVLLLNLCVFPSAIVGQH